MSTVTFPETNRLSRLMVAAGVLAILGLAFQVGHFAEHALQFAIWLLGDLSNICGRDTPWMSPWVMALCQRLGLWIAPDAPSTRQVMLGMEVLHLVGNSIFLTGLMCLYKVVPSRWVRWAIYIETFHLYEHIMLTATAFFLGKPVGMSTLFGGTSLVDSREFAVGVRVSWHFAMNLLPMPFAMLGIMEFARDHSLRAMLVRNQGS
ncbi:hypothetical protein EFR00_28415 [Rhizobium sophoriradicis]|uniref:DUF6008 family protein n=1 Tax=Rhizobium sophoriradicis TaxID=1535245 RepID=UPI00098F8849|nr:DUF6008 family protein [Rhizobium sophoriradicis]RSB86883.1 hypothetical protein EFR00_28415 [Rhizobium sophoriradicis]